MKIEQLKKLLDCFEDQEDIAVLVYNDQTQENVPRFITGIGTDFYLSEDYKIIVLHIE